MECYTTQLGLWEHVASHYSKFAKTVVGCKKGNYSDKSMKETQRRERERERKLKIVSARDRTGDHLRVRQM